MEYRPYILSESAERHNITVANRNVTCFCPKCSMLYSFQTSGMITSYGCNENRNVRITPTYQVTCECGYFGNLTPVDSDLEYCARALHSKGYLLNEEYIYDLQIEGANPKAFLVFQNAHTFPYGLPRGWKLHGTLLYTVEKRKEAVAELLKWVKDHHLDTEIQPWWEDL